MKKISLFALALATSAAVFAQETQPQLRTSREVTTRFGVRGGVNLADLNSKNVSGGYAEAQSKTAFNGGFFVNIPIARTLRFQPEISYSSQGGKVQEASGSASGKTFEQDLDYINVPLNFQLMSNNGIFVQTGPQLGFLVGAEAGDATANSGVTNGGNKTAFDKFDLSWTGGVGYLSRIGLGFEARYNIGIANVIADDAPANAPLKGTWKNSVGQFSLIYHFGANK